MRPVVSVALFALGWGCGSNQPPNLGDTDSGNNVTIVKTGGCSVEGQTVACQVVTGESNGIVNCFHGVQTCTNGQWGVCGTPSDASVTTTDASSDATIEADASAPETGSSDAEVADAADAATD